MPIQVATIETANHNQNEKEILIVDRTLNSLGANRSIIAVALDFQGWKTFYGGSEWTEEYVNGLLDGFRVKKKPTITNIINNNDEIHCSI